MSDVLTIWLIYYGARNHPPGKWVVRAQDVGDVSPLESPDRIRRHAMFFECDSLLEARSKVPIGLYRMPRDPSDDPVIVETWM